MKKFMKSWKSDDGRSPRGKGKYVYTVNMMVKSYVVSIINP